MRVLVLGAGAIGGHYGARLIRAGHDVTFLVRPARALRLAATGLRVQGAADFSAPVNATTAVNESDAPYDLVIVSCKAWDLELAIESIAPAITVSTYVLPLLNGLRHLEALDAAFGSSRVLGGVCHVSVTLETDGTVRQFGRLDRLTFGSRDRSAPLPSLLSDGLLALGEGVAHSDGILAAMWEKFAFIATLAGITCLMRGSIGEIVATSEGVDLIRRLHAECAEAARAGGHPIATDAIAAAEGVLLAPGSPLKASMLRDLERGSRTEAEHILGDLRARAQSCAIDTPLLSAALAHLRIYELQRQAIAAAVDARG